MAQSNPVTIRDFSQGRFAKDVVSPALIPQNSVANSLNVNYDEIIGSGKVRNGATALGSPPALGFPAIGLAEFVPRSGSLIGSELVTNGNFTGSATGWTLGTGWSYGTNNAQWNTPGGVELVTNGGFTGSASGWTLNASGFGDWMYNTNKVSAASLGGDVQQSGVSLIEGASYVMTFNTSSMTGTIFGYLGVFNDNIGQDQPDFTTSGTHVATFSNVPFTVTSFGIGTLGGSFVGNLTNISLKEIVPSGPLSQDIGLVAGQEYTGVITTGGDFGTVTVQLGSMGDSFVIAAGQSSVPLTGFAGGDSVLYIYADNTFDGTVDGVSVKQQFNRLLLSVFNGSTPTGGTLYVWDGSSWTASNLNFLTNYIKCRFSTLGGSEFFTNSSEGMYTSTDGLSWSNGAPNNCIVGPLPSLVYRYSQRMLAAGDPSIPDRVYFSSVIDPTSSPFITWNVDPATGDWIDVNPDDGGTITGFSEASTFLLVFKDTGMYRMDVVNKTVDPDNIFNVGAVNQECIVLCQGVVYFFSGKDIRRTNGGYPEQISRTGVQDIIDTMTPSQWQNVGGGTDGLNVWWSLGNIVLNQGQDEQRTINDCVIKFSTRDQTWSVHSYSANYTFFAQYTDNNGPLLRAANDGGGVATIDLGTTDDGNPIYFFLDTQELEFGNRATLKEISDEFAIFLKNGGSSTMSGRTDMGDFQPLLVSLADRVNIGKDINLQGSYFVFRWEGQSTGTSPVFEGLYFEKVTDKGVVKL